MINQHKFIFIGGLHRSGTSIVHRCLREHPLISGFENTPAVEDEGQHLQSVYLAAKHFGGVGKFAFDPNARLTEESNLISETNKLKLFNDWQKYWDLDKPYLAEKSPPNIIRMRFLQVLFPNSFFMIVTRHPIAVSYATKVWRPDLSMISLFEHWLAAHEILNQDSKFIKNILVIKHEYFIDKNEECLNQICSFLQISTFSPSEKIIQNTNGKYFDIWEQKRNYLLRKYATWKYEHQLNQFGYSFLSV